MTYLNHAKTELDLLAAKLTDKDNTAVQLEVFEDILELVEVYVDSGATVYSAVFTLHNLARLLLSEPLTPLTGEEDEWGVWFTHIAGGILRQNKRCPRVFQKEDLTAYEVSSKVLVSYSGLDSHNYEKIEDITFPYIPTTEFTLVE